MARDRRGAPLGQADLGVPRTLIHRALRTRRDLLSMTFDPLGEGGIRPEMSVADLELRSRGVRAADSGAHRLSAGHHRHLAQRYGGRALYGFARLRGRSFGGQSRDSADAGARSVHHSRKRAAARRRTRQAAHGGRAEPGARPSSRDCCPTACRPKAGFAPLDRASRRARWAATISTCTRPVPTSSRA